jgi:hypothetical protein
MTDLGWWLQNFRRSAFRLETLALYQVPQEAEWFAEWRRSSKLPELTPENDSWLELVAEARQHGRQIQRVHLITPPLTDYLRFEFALQAASVACGEDCRVADQTEHPELAGVDADFWLFDDQAAVVLDYDYEGRFLQASARDDARRYCELRDRVMDCSVSLKEYLAKL